MRVSLPKETFDRSTEHIWPIVRRHPNFEEWSVHLSAGICRGLKRAIVGSHTCRLSAGITCAASKPKGLYMAIPASLRKHTSAAGEHAQSTSPAAPSPGLPLQDSARTFQRKLAFLVRMSSQCWQLPEAGRGPADTRVHPSDFIEGDQTVLIVLHKLSDIAEGALPVVQT